MERKFLPCSRPCLKKKNINKSPGTNPSQMSLWEQLSEATENQSFEKGIIPVLFHSFP